MRDFDTILVIDEDNPEEYALLISHKVGNHVPLDVGMAQMEAYNRGAVELDRRLALKFEDCPLERSTPRGTRNRGDWASRTRYGRWR